MTTPSRRDQAPGIRNIRTLVDPSLLKYVSEYLMVQLMCRVVFDLNDVILLYLTLVYSYRQGTSGENTVYQDQGPQLHYPVEVEDPLSSCSNRFASEISVPNYHP